MGCVQSQPSRGHHSTHHHYTSNKNQQQQHSKSAATTGHHRRSRNQEFYHQHEEMQQPHRGGATNTQKFGSGIPQQKYPNTANTNETSAVIIDKNGQHLWNNRNRVKHYDVLHYAKL